MNHVENVKQKQLKQCELALLLAFKTVCEQLDLTYYLVEGSLLGAVRHQGFIPWDDDIDVAMPRCDYERFLREAQALLPSYYFVQSLDSEPAFHANFAKLRDSRTTFIESSVRNRPINHGVYIDIFPLDFVPQNHLVRAMVSFADRLCTLRVAQVFTLPQQLQPQRTLTKRIKHRIGNSCARILLPTLRQALIVQKHLYTVSKHGENLISYCSTWKGRESMPAEWYGKGTELTFEGITMPVPAQYDRWLTQVYGDYRTLPPVEQRISHHDTECIDLERPYTTYVQQQRRNGDE